MKLLLLLTFTSAVTSSFRGYERNDNPRAELPVVSNNRVTYPERNLQAACPPVPPGSCNICGQAGQCVQNLNLKVPIPLVFESCNNLQAAGYKGTELGNLLFEQCVPISKSGTVAPCGCANTAACSNVPPDGCSICGNNKCVSNPDSQVTFPAYERKCVDIQKDGINGKLSTEYCNELPGLIGGFCGCAAPTSAPTRQPTASPTQKPTREPTRKPTKMPTPNPTQMPTPNPTQMPTRQPTHSPTNKPTREPTRMPTRKPTRAPTREPTRKPTKQPTDKPTLKPTQKPTDKPTQQPTGKPTAKPTDGPTSPPTLKPTAKPTNEPTPRPTPEPTTPRPTGEPTLRPTARPTPIPPPPTPIPTFPPVAPFVVPTLPPVAPFVVPTLPPVQPVPLPPIQTLGPSSNILTVPPNPPEPTLGPIGIGTLVLPPTPQTSRGDGKAPTPAQLKYISSNVERPTVFVSGGGGALPGYVIPEASIITNIFENDDIAEEGTVP